MRILVLVHKLTGGGAERVASLWVTGFVEKGYQVGVVLNCERKTPITYSIPVQAKIFNIYGNRFIGWIVNKLRKIWNFDSYYIFKLNIIFQNYKPDIVIGVLQPWAEWAKKASTELNIKIINTEHNSFERPVDALYNPMTKSLYWQKYEQNKQYDHVTVLTDADKRCVDGILENVSVLPNPLAYLPIKKIHHKQKIVLAAGRLDAWHVKGFDLLIKAWTKVSDGFPDWRLQIVGDSKGEGLRFLQKIAGDYDKKRIDFLGYQNDMLPIYQKSSIFVMPSRYEGFGMVLIEAMSQGCASIACDYKGRQCEIITSDKEGIICPIDDVNCLANSIKKLIDDNEYRELVQKNGVERSKYYELNNIMRMWDVIIKEVSNESI